MKNKHKHLFKKIAQFKTIEELVTQYKCKCGKKMEFVDVITGEWAKGLPDEFTENL